MNYKTLAFFVLFSIGTVSSAWADSSLYERFNKLLGAREQTVLRSAVSPFTIFIGRAKESGEIIFVDLTKLRNYPDNYYISLAAYRVTNGAISLRTVYQCGWRQKNVTFYICGQAIGLPLRLRGEAELKEIRQLILASANELVETRAVMIFRHT